MLGVRTVSPTTKNILDCLLETGHGLDREGGSPVDKRVVAGGASTMVLESGTWKVDRATADPSVSCGGVTLPRGRKLTRPRWLGLSLRPAGSARREGPGRAARPGATPRG